MSSVNLFQVVRRKNACFEAGVYNVKSPSIWLPIIVMSTSLNAVAQIINFDNDEVGKTPASFSTALTGKGKPGNWVVMNDETAPSAPNILSQTDMDKTDYRFPLCIFDSFSSKDIDISVKFKAVNGNLDQAGGIVWRYKDKDNYYVVRANALENNFRIYYVVEGKRRQFAGASVRVAPRVWHTIRVVSIDNRFEAFFDGKKLIEATDNTIQAAGRVGVWTKADSHTLFDDVKLKAISR